MKYTLLILAFILGTNGNSLLAQGSHDYAANTVIFKVKPEFRSLCEASEIKSPALSGIIQNLSSYELKKIFPLHKPPSTRLNEDGIPLVDLGLIYELRYSGETPLNKLIHNISKLNIIEYAQHRFIAKLMYVPNDDSSSLALQYHLNTIQAYAAWDVTKGDTNIVIGITDTGIDPNHADLVGNIKYNYGDIIDGVDNDNDGFVDNYRGWDMAMNDKDPTSIDADHHGTRVAGIAAESTDNGIQGAGVAYRCKFLPIKIQDDITEYLTAGYEGIVYAADHGCQIINCSWGAYYAEQFEIDVINYATVNKNALVIAAAGNGNNQTPLYPASIKSVISVAATNSNDEKWISSPGYGSTYNRGVDVCAPGDNIYSTVAGGFTNVLSGTSFASPVVAGCAAIVKSRFPNYSALQIGEQLKVTTDVIDTLIGNFLYQEKLGSGRVNLFKAVTDTAGPSIVMIKQNFSDGNDERFAGGDTINFRGTFKNYLAPTSGVDVFVALSSTNSNITITQSTVNIGNINTLDTAGNYTNPLSFRIEPSIGTNVAVELKFEYTSGTYIAYEYVTIYVNPAHIDITENNISTSLTNKARIGYEDDYPYNDGTGLGFQYNGEQMIFEAGLMIGAQIGSSTYVSDNVWDSIAPDADYINVQIAASVSSTVADFEAYCVVNDDGAGADTMDITVGQTVYAWTNAPDDNYIMIQYRIVNTGLDTLMNLYAGINADWDILNFEKNRTASEQGTRMGYVKSTEAESPYGGIKLLSNGPFVHYAIDNYANAPGLDVFGKSFTTAMKYTALSTSRLTAGTNGSGNDVIDVVSSGPFTLAPSDTIMVCFAMLAGDDLTDIVSTAQAAQIMYDSLYPEPVDTTTSLFGRSQSPDIEIYPNPSTGEVVVIVSNQGAGSTTFELFDLAGSLVYTSLLTNHSGYSEHDLSNLKAGIYQFRVRSADFESRGKLVLVQ